ncbi:MAG: NCS2 family permease [Sphaerochaeta sp.]
MTFRAFLDKKFQLSTNRTNIRTEFIAGLTTFLTCTYILAVNPAILSSTGMDAKAVFYASAISSALSCFAMGLMTNYPFALAPAMGLNAYFAYTVCGTLGLSWQNALACVFVEGVSFCILSFIGVQEKIVNAIPECIKQAISAAIGFFIAFAGLNNAGIIVSDPNNLLQLGNLQNPGVQIALLGILLTAGLVIKRVRGGILIGILAITFIGLFVTDPVTGTAYTKWNGIIALENPVTALSPTFFKLKFSGLFSGGVVAVIGVLFAMFSFLFVDLFDSIGVLVGVGIKAGFINEKGELPNAGKALFVSAAGAAVGSLLGTQTVTVFGAESTTGIAEGGRTGLTSCFTGFLFLLALLFAPLFLMIPSIATAPALVMVGIFMIEPLMHVNLSDTTIAFPVFICVAFMAFTFNIAYGILFGLLAFTGGQVFAGNARKLTFTTWILTGIFVLYLVLEIIFR